MPDNSIKLPWGKAELSLDLPESWRVLGVLEPAQLAAVEDVGLAVRSALRETIGMPGLSRLVKPGMRIAIVIDDDSRPTPVASLFPAVMFELQAGGVSAQAVTVVPALGIHRAMTEVEVARRIGPDWIENVGLETHDCDDPAKLVRLGVTRRGTPVLINKVVAQADLVVSIGCIEPHIIASFGGGYKNLVLGVAGRETIAHNHTLNCAPQTFNNVGCPVDQNPMRLDLEEAAGMLKPPVFIVNAVLNSSLQVVRIVCGHPIQAHRQGIETSAAIYGVRAPALADVVITCSHPMDQDLRQGVKALANNVRALKPGGFMLTLVRADEGVGVFGLANRKLPIGRSGLKLLAPLLVKLVPRLHLKGMGEEDRFFLYFALQAMRRGDLWMYAPTIPEATQANLPFVRFAATVEQALAAARSRFPNQASVLVIPHGGSTYPISNEI
jgi:lactate racemase